ncbi:MotA/TolQ/ExbB proton channel family protein [Candidatus Hydrogenosomobacter endosymbioticus]|uniref:MotA/TolQ/ExbB proton channel domain-containing protein n=1 Tax=Candidatus Hydrogenosomobacter endosymbioticus TaxID=2558174 RepID=A0ABM7V892_9PROT|nr:MotA/TolQ/ExbB proton channel family protein [Candidatus Hydrogenosomobacter endosymbioticus]BDB95989.1 hypothetical protein HYD_1220 [Candidatus Hydrogenosomobacter endosymbioticus]
MTDCGVCVSAGGLSLWAMFLQADLVVKSVMVLLALLSVRSWTVIFSKFMSIKRAREEAEEVMDYADQRDILDGGIHMATGLSGSFADLMVLSVQETQKAKDYGSAGLSMWHQHLLQLMGVIMEEQKDELHKGLGFLDWCAAASPFIGLFGTVWGIMHSFHVAVSGKADIAVIAPGMAEALFATAMGLVVAIPCLIAYNKLSLEVIRFTLKMENFAQELSAAALQKVCTSKSDFL